VHPTVQKDRSLLVALTITGLAALALEVLWSRAMIPWVGGTALSQITTVGVYMAGLFVGSAAAVPRLARIADPRRAFFRLELAAALLSLLAVVAMPLADPLFALFSRGELLGGAAGSILRGLTGAGLMIPATVLMGFSFPLAIAAFERGQGGRGNAALAYGVNTVGATLGTLLGGFVLVPRLGVTAGAMAVAAFDALALLLLMRTSPPAAYHAQGRDGAAPARAATAIAPPATEPREWPMLLSIFLGGMVSLGLQAILFRVLGLLLGPTARAFTVVLAVYVGGLGIGALLVKWLVERGPRAASLAYLACWALVGVSGILVFAGIESLVGVVAVDGSAAGAAVGAQLRLRAIVAAVVLLPITVAFGASYSAAVAAAPRGDAARASRLYAALTLGNIIGLCVVAWGVLPTFRLDRALLLVLASALVVPLPALFSLPIGRGARIAAAAAAPLAAVASWFALPGWPLHVLHSAPYARGYGNSALSANDSVVRFHRAAFETSVSVSQDEEDLYLELDGKTTGSTELSDRATQSLLGALPAALHPAPRSAFVIGLGTGQTPAEVLRHADVARLDCAEISPEVVDTMPLFAAINRRCDLDPRFRMLEADGRTVLRYGGTTYDLVISEPSNVWIPGVAHLFTSESFADVAGCLEPERGLAVQWVQGYGLEIDTLRTIVRTFLDHFPHASLWFASLEQPDIFLLGARRPLALDFAVLEGRLAAAQVPNVHVGGRPFDAVGLLRHFVAGSDALRRFAGDGPRTTDARPSLEYAAEEALFRDAGAPGATLIATLAEAPLALFDGAAAPPGDARERLVRRAEANREFTARIIDPARFAALFTSAGIDDLERLLRLHQDDDEFRWSATFVLMTGLARLLHGPQEQAAFALMGRVARLVPEHPESLKFAALQRLPDRTAAAEALALIDRHRAASPEWRQKPLVDRAKMLHSMGRTVEALAILESVVARDRWYATGWRELEAMAREAGRVELAARCEARLLELADDGRSREAQARLAAEMAAIDDLRRTGSAPDRASSGGAKRPGAP
jgi:spermidine synthase